MFGPYRTPPELPREDEARPAEERVLGWVLFAIGALRVVLALAGHETWGVEVTVAAVLVALGVTLVTSR